ncbi:ras-related protein Rab-37-like isoform X2 [Argopecten irradians]|uniref:ras-related protein Rab-37-like isoform X2 n=1 Tax=Argopecten irradians TaxID=31199 RepID=UPI00371324F5
MFTTRVFITNLNDNFHTYKVECLFNPSWIMGPRPLLMECMDSCLIVCKFKGFILHVHRSQSGFQHTNITALLLLYDVTNKNSFDNIRAWLGEINEYAQEDVVIMLLGNKSDSAADRVIRTEDGEKLAKEYGVAFMETSAKTGMNVDLAFMAVARFV